MFDVHGLVRDDDGLYDEDEWEDYREGLLEEFEKSAEAKALMEQGRCLNWSAMYLDYAMSYHSATPVEIDAGEHNEIVFSLIPRKVMVEAKRAGEIVDELRAFWQFLDREYQLPLARRLAEGLDDAAADNLRAELADDGNFGMAKSLFSMARAQGYDITDEVELQKFMLAYNLALRQGPAPIPFDEPMDEWGEPAEKLRGVGWTKTVMNKNDKRKKAKAQRQAKKRNRR